MERAQAHIDDPAMADAVLDLGDGECGGSSCRHRQVSAQAIPAPERSCTCGLWTRAPTIM